MGGRILRDPIPLSPEYVPRDLIGRDRELRDMAQHFLSPALEHSSSPLMILIGPRGSGKTALLKRFGQLIEVASLERGRAMKCAYVNCWEAKGRLFKILEAASASLGVGEGLRGRSSKELLDLIGQIPNREAFPILALDDAEALLLAEGGDPIYMLSRPWESAGIKGFGLLLSFGDWSYLEGLDGSVLSTLRRGILRLRGYSKAELWAILADRAERALGEGSLKGDALDLIADSSSASGDAGLAIRALRIAAELAEREGATSIEARHAEWALVEASASPDPYILRGLSDHERLFLIAIARALGERGSGEVTMGEAEGEYLALCGIRGLAPRKHTQLWKYARRLSIAGLLSLRPSGAGFKGRTTFIGLRGLRWDKVINCPEPDGAAMGR
ncbi:MAG: AAA family ATPase [Candidatus Bathyarchaeia archaeon]